MGGGTLAASRIPLASTLGVDAKKRALRLCLESIDALHAHGIPSSFQRK